MATVLKVILAILLPPVAAFLQVGLSLHFWINIVLTLIGWIPGVIHALYLIFAHGGATAGTPATTRV